MSATEYIYDRPLEASRRLAWAKFFSARKELEAERLRVVEMAVWIEQLNPPDDHPVWSEVAAALDQQDAFQLVGIRRYVDWRVEEAQAVTA